MATTIKNGVFTDRIPVKFDVDPRFSACKDPVFAEFSWEFSDNRLRVIKKLTRGEKSIEVRSWADCKLEMLQEGKKIDPTEGDAVLDFLSKIAKAHSKDIAVVFANGVLPDELANDLDEGIRVLGKCLKEGSESPIYMTKLVIDEEDKNEEEKKDLGPGEFSANYGVMLSFYTDFEKGLLSVNGQEIRFDGGIIDFGTADQDLWPHGDSDLFDIFSLLEIKKA